MVQKNEIVVLTKIQTFLSLVVVWLFGLEKQIDGAEGLFYSDKEKLEAKGATVHMNAPVLSIDYDKKKLQH